MASHGFLGGANGFRPSTVGPTVGFIFSGKCGCHPRVNIFWFPTGRTGALGAPAELPAAQDGALPSRRAGVLYQEEHGRSA